MTRAVLNGMIYLSAYARDAGTSWKMPFISIDQNRGRCLLGLRLLAPMVVFNALVCVGIVLFVYKVMPPISDANLPIAWSIVIPPIYFASFFYLMRFLMAAPYLKLVGLPDGIRVRYGGFGYQSWKIGKWMIERIYSLPAMAVLYTGNYGYFDKKAEKSKVGLPTRWRGFIPVSSTGRCLVIITHEIGYLFSSADADGDAAQLAAMYGVPSEPRDEPPFGKPANKSTSIP